MPASPPRKRLRPEVDADKDDVERDCEFWFEDGTVTLIVSNVEFRVYKGTLVEHSPVLADMFSLPQPNGAGHEHPVVHLPDSPHAWRHVLRVLFPRSSTPILRLEPWQPTYAQISAYVRLGHKYQILEPLLLPALAFLRAHYARDYATWYVHAYAPEPWRDCRYAIGVVNLARLAAPIYPTVLAVLPAAMAVCATLGPSGVLDGLAGDEDGTVEHLAEDDARRVLDAIPRLMLATASGVLRAFAPCPAPVGCARLGTGGCGAGVRTLLCTYARDPRLVAGVHPFWDWEMYFDADFGVGSAGAGTGEGAGICEACREVLKERLLAEQKATWNRLLEMFGRGGESLLRPISSDFEVSGCCCVNLRV